MFGKFDFSIGHTGEVCKSLAELGVDAWFCIDEGMDEEYVLDVNREGKDLIGLSFPLCKTESSEKLAGWILKMLRELALISECSFDYIFNCLKQEIEDCRETLLV